MSKARFRCRLLSNVILQSQSTIGQLQRSIDFIPGNIFLGIMARKYDSYSKGQQMNLFHNGTVRYGDAHPVVHGGCIRSLKIPASLYYPKLKGMEGGLYIHHIYNRGIDNEDDGRPQQLKQCRNGFYVFDVSKKQMSLVDLGKSLSLKSAYDRERRASEDNKMYIYESLKSGAEFLFEVDFDDEALRSIIVDGLKGSHFIGRSRTAQFGHIKITDCQYQDIPSNNMTESDECVTVYADGRLIFLDEHHATTLHPTSEQLGITGGEIDWSRSQIRTFQYAPWNGKRQAYDTDRCGIEKGSVFVVKTDSPQHHLASTYIGSYQNEGFGKVIYNPDFLQYDNTTNGKCRYAIISIAEKAGTSDEPINEISLLVKHLIRAKEDDKILSFIYKEVNNFIVRYSEYYYDSPNTKERESFASQWGQIREMAKKSKGDSDLKTDINDFLNKTVGRKAKWDENQRLNKLNQFIDTISKYHGTAVITKGEMVRVALLNLSIEIAKKSREHQNKIRK